MAHGGCIHYSEVRIFLISENNLSKMTQTGQSTAADTHCSSSSCSRQSSHTRTRHSWPMFGIAIVLLAHLAHNALPQFRQWCYPNSQPQSFT